MFLYLAEPTSSMLILNSAHCILRGNVIKQCPKEDDQHYKRGAVKRQDRTETEY